MWDNYIISSQYCTSNVTGFCGVGGTWDPGALQTQDNKTIFFEKALDDRNSSGIVMQGPYFTQNLNVGWTKGGLNSQSYTMANSSTTVVDQGNITLPDGSISQLEIGYLSLGADHPTQSFTLSNTSDVPPIISWNMPGYFYNHSITKSMSYTMHVGSTGFGFPGSLIFGGYDKGRAIGPGTSWGDTPPQLLDIVIGVEVGGSPFTFESKTGLLQDANGNPKSFPAEPEPLTPYLHLPQISCDALADLLPVTVDQSSGYYLWNTTDAAYKTIVASPAYLGFVFPPAPGGTDPVTIKVPFALLNLNLTAPAIHTGTKPYFPCRPYSPSAGGKYLLGRAFLQAAFIGRNWNQHVSWLAQAPGPGTSNTGLGQLQQDIEDSDTSLEYFNGNDLFNQSWTGHWTPLPMNGAISTASNTTGSPTALPTSKPTVGFSSTIIGVVIGGTAFCLVCIAGGVFFFRRRKKRASKPSEQHDRVRAWLHQHQSTSSYAEPGKYHSYGAQMLVEMPHQKDPLELPATPTLRSQRRTLKVLPNLPR